MKQLCGFIDKELSPWYWMNFLGYDYYWLIPNTRCNLRTCLEHVTLSEHLTFKGYEEKARRKYLKKS